MGGTLRAKRWAWTVKSPRPSFRSECAPLQADPQHTDSTDLEKTTRTSYIHPLNTQYTPAKMTISRSGWMPKCPEHSSQSSLFVEPVGGGDRPIHCSSAGHARTVDPGRQGIKRGSSHSGVLRRAGWNMNANRQGRHNPIHVGMKGFGNGGKGGKNLTHHLGLIMMKWSIWVIRGILGTVCHAFFSHQLVSFLHHTTSPYATRADHSGPSGTGTYRWRERVHSRVFTRRCVLKVFDTSGMERFSKAASTGSRKGLRG